MRSAVGMIVAGLLVASPAAAAGEDPVPWAKVGDWNVMVDTSLNNGCFMVGSYTRGEILRLGIDNRNANGYLMIANPSVWGSIEVGKEYRLQFQFDQESPWFGNFTAIRMGNGVGTVALMNVFTDAKFLREFSAKQGLSISYNGSLVTWVPLTGTYAAVQSLIQCQQANNGTAAARPSPSDPFSGGAPRRAPPDGGGFRTTNDPFKM